MTALEIRGNAVVVNGNTIDVGSRILDARASASLVLIRCPAFAVGLTR